MSSTSTPTTAVITGASGGIGEAIARQLAAAKYDLILIARSEGKLATLAAELNGTHGISAEVMTADLAVPGAGAALAERLGDRHVGLLVNNAGFGDYGAFADADPAKIDQMMALNIVALTDLTRAVLPAMISRKTGRVMNIASVAAFMPGPLMAVYYATKAYVLSFSEAIHNELMGTGVTVTAVCPGPVASGFQAGAEMEGSKLVSGKKLMSAETCAKLAITATMKGTPVVITGARNRMQVVLLKLVPRRLLPGIVRRVQAPTH